MTSHEVVSSVLFDPDGSRTTEIQLFFLFHFESISVDSDITRDGTIGSSILNRQAYHRESSVRKPVSQLIKLS